MSTTPPPQATPLPSSSFPISSPTFWDEAAAVAIPPIPLKRPRLSRSPSEEDESHQEAKRARPSSPSTSLSYLPNRTDLIVNSAHSYLQNAEYAPNRFGDVADYMRKKEVKVQTQNRDIAMASARADLPPIFANLSFWINGNTHPPMEELRKMILQRGGEVRPTLYSKGYVKYIIAPVLTNAKFKEFANYKVVKEAWIVESCKQGKLLDWTRFKLQVVGGWEETGRKGLEGFLKGATPQIDVKPVEESQPIPQPAQVIRQSVPVVAAGKSLLPPLRSTQRATSSTAPALSSQTPESLPRSAPVSSGKTALGAEPLLPLETSLPKSTTVASDDTGPAVVITPIKVTKPLGRSRPSPAIPISPNPASKTPAKVQMPEGLWEFYHSKESNEDAARLLKDQEWRLKNTAERGNEGGFIDGYYQNSRLHHLSTWKAELKVLVSSAQAQSESLSLSKPSVSTLSLSTSVLPKAQPLRDGIGAKEKHIFHVDFDAFFVSCGLATRPHLKGKPAVVCHSQAGRQEGSTSEVASASYEARAKGVRNGMSLGRARELVGEDLATIPYEFETYKKFSLAFYTILMGYADDLQAVSVDEALIDATSAVHARELAPEEAVDGPEVESGKRRVRDWAVEVAEKIRDDVRTETGCEVSIGVSHNILLAKLATRRAKPAGVFHLLSFGIAEFLAPLDVEDLPSIGWSIKSRIAEKFGTSNCAELLIQSKENFKKLLGPKTGEMVFGYLRGMDDRKLERDKERKSISAEMNYGIRFQTQEQAVMCMIDLAKEVSKRMRNVGSKGRLLTLKLMRRHPDAPIEPPKFLGHGWCETFTKSTAIGNKGGGATDDPDILGTESVKLLKSLALDPKELRGVGIQITKLDGEKPAEREVGQGVLQFDKKAPKQSGGKSEGRDETPPVQVIDVSDSPSPPSVKPAELPKAAKNAEAGPSRVSPLAANGIDPDFLAALPPELRDEVRRDHARSRSASVDPLPPGRAERKGKHPAAHITKQLRPKNKTSLKAAEIAELPLYGAWSKTRSRSESVDVDMEANEKIGIYKVSELKDLGIDPDVFRELPGDMQKEIVLEERGKMRKRKILHKPAAMGRDREASWASASPSRARQGSMPPAIQRARVVRPTKPMLFRQSELENVLLTIRKWIESRASRGFGPAAEDAKRVQKYLKKCMLDSGFGGMETVVEVLKFMRSVLREYWESEEDVAGKEWWDCWREYRAEMEEVCVRRFGAGMRL
ncbi:DNA repair protein REV1, partial [Tremellales sp. Uapishka_1]